MTFYWLLFCFVVLLSCLIAVQELVVPGRAEVMHFGVHFVTVAVLSLFAGGFLESGSVDYKNYVDMPNVAPPATTWKLLTLKNPPSSAVGFFPEAS